MTLYTEKCRCSKGTWRDTDFSQMTLQVTKNQNNKCYMEEIMEQDCDVYY